MRIKTIEITNIKGISNTLFNLELIANKPNLLVAPNGFGKSSFGVAFESLRRKRIELEEKNYHQGDSTKRPVLAIAIEDGAGVRTIIANDTQNTINDEFDTFVINSQLMAKAKLLNIGGTRIAVPSMEIAPIILVKTIPPKTHFNYDLKVIKQTFGNNSKILTNITALFECAPLLFDLLNDVDFSKFGQIKISAQLNAIKAEINAQNGNAEQIKQWIEINKAAAIQGISEFQKLSSILRRHDQIKTDAESYLAAYQFVDVYNSMGNNFRKAVDYALYQDDKAYYERTIASFNSTRHRIRPKEDKKANSLIVEWPKAHEISNGQRDVLSFVTMLMKSKRSLRKQNCILIIDEIFDYLDDANLISFQYFITTMIEEMKAEGKQFFPILLTHLDPLFFNHFCFNKHKIKVVYLKDIPFTSNPNMTKLITKREDPSIQPNVDKHHFHYYPTHIDISGDFTALSLPSSWGNSQRFHQFIDGEVKKFLNDQTNYDPLAICFGVRVRIEYLIYEAITDPIKKQNFLNEHGTKKKLEYCEGAGITVPESYYLLGIIYNHQLHLKDTLSSAKPLAIKLENLTIKNLIREIFK